MADRRQLFKKATAEFLVIVTGILAALSVDEYRESRATAAVEQQYLRRLAADLDDAERSLSKGLTWSRSRAQAGRAVLSHLDGQPLPPTRLIIAAYEVNLIPISAERRLGRRTTYDELLNTGNLVTIRDMAMRDALARYYEEYARVGARLNDAPEGWRIWVRRMMPPDVLLAVDASSSSTTAADTATAAKPDPDRGVAIPSEVQVRFVRRLAADADYARGELNRLIQYQDRQILDLEEFLEATVSLRARLDPPVESVR